MEKLNWCLHRTFAPCSSACETEEAALMDASFLDSHLLKFPKITSFSKENPCIQDDLCGMLGDLWAPWLHPKNFWFRKWENNAHQMGDSWKRRKSSFWNMFLWDTFLPFQTQSTCFLPNPPLGCPPPLSPSLPLEFCRFLSAHPWFRHILSVSCFPGAILLPGRLQWCLTHLFIRKERMRFKIRVLERSYIFCVQ